MKHRPELKWLFMDLDSYFATIEQQEHPHLRGRPVAVIPMETDYTCVIAASYEAKAYGIKTGTMVKVAKKMCPDLHCVLARHDIYLKYHLKIIEETARHTPINNICSIDELSSRLPPSKRNINAAKEIAVNIKNGIKNNVGEAIGCSIGVAPNSLLAKIACEVNKPNGLAILQQKDLPKLLFDLKLTDIPGIGKNIERRMHKANIRSIKDLWNIPPKHARKIWGSVQGERFWYLLHGYDLETPETYGTTAGTTTTTGGNITMIGHSRILDPAMRSPENARQMARQLLIKACRRLRAKGLYAGQVSLSIRTTCNIKWSKIYRTDYACDPFTFLEALDYLWLEMIEEIQQIIITTPPSPSHLASHSLSSSSALPRLKLSGLNRPPDIFIFKDILIFKKVSVALQNINSKNLVSADLFETAQEENIAKNHRYAALTRALDHLQDKYKYETVSLGITPKTKAGYVGTKISFSRVPDIKEFQS